jgi:hypothetical protein
MGVPESHQSRKCQRVVAEGDMENLLNLSAIDGGKEERDSCARGLEVGNQN